MPRADVGLQQDRAEVLGVDDLGPARHLEHDVGQRRAQHQEAAARCAAATSEPSGWPMRSSCATMPGVGVEGRARAQRHQVAPVLRVDQQHALARAQRAGRSRAALGARLPARAERARAARSRAPAGHRAATRALRWPQARSERQPQAPARERRRRITTPPWPWPWPCGARGATRAPSPRRTRPAARPTPAPATAGLWAASSPSRRGRIRRIFSSSSRRVALGSVTSCLGRRGQSALGRPGHDPPRASAP